MGFVTTTADIDGAGRISRLVSRGHPLLVSSVEEAMRSAKFSVACFGNPVTIRFSFRLDPNLDPQTPIAVKALAINDYEIVAPARQISVTISEPATVKIGELFKQADIVAIVKVLSGDSEHYSTTVYKAEVLTAFKGTRNTERLYFGPFISYGVGSEYLMFLRKSKGELRISRNVEGAGLNYGTIGTSYQVMFDGYSVMEVSSACVFEEKGSQ